MLDCICFGRRRAGGHGRRRDATGSTTVSTNRSLQHHPAALKLRTWGSIHWSVQARELTSSSVHDLGSAAFSLGLGQCACAHRGCVHSRPQAMCMTSAVLHPVSISRGGAGSRQRRVHSGPQARCTTSVVLLSTQTLLHSIRASSTVQGLSGSDCNHSSKHCA